jgi:hypothetical protein
LSGRGPEENDFVQIIKSSGINVAASH